ncbi:DNA primase family protein [Aureimonas ureilytica]|uniref:DNA primase family protein n=1 Tax=Aureimonas ureilytica TaxID=401562 RepID=UPI00037735A8|nr:DNA primase family protein [Aureimonas ureilytica]
MTKKADPRLAAISEMLANAKSQSGPALTAAADVIPEEGEDLPVARSLDIPRAAQTEDASERIVLWCAGLDHSDTDNGRRLIAHFGADLTVLRQEGGKTALYGVWTGTHWDIANGNSAAHGLAQLLGDRILLEADCLRLSNGQMFIITEAKKARDKPEGSRTDDDRDVIKKAERIEGQFTKRAAERLDWAVYSKNARQIDAMLKCAAPHLLRDADSFNSDHYKVAVRGHTLTFHHGTELVPNPDLEREDAPADAPSVVPAKYARFAVRIGHDRQDYITAVIPTSYDPKATCPRLTAFLEEFMPDRARRRFLQVAFGLGLLGITPQKIFFHLGSGANGKSIVMEVICRVLGGYAVTLEANSFFGESGQAGGASPDLARLPNARLLRVPELPEGEELRVDLAKKLTGGEKIAARPLFGGYFEFYPLFTTHMSGNGYPKITDLSNGIWRRLEVIHWPVTIPVERQRNFDEVVREFEAEHSGILNWLIEGALIYLREGLVTPTDVTVQNKKYRAAMDPTAAFRDRCVVADHGGSVTAREMYEAYLAFAEDSAILPIKQTLFGRIMVKHHEREDGRIRRYLNVKLVDVPERQRRGRGHGEEQPEEYPEGYAGPAPKDGEE